MRDGSVSARLRSEAAAARKLCTRDASPRRNSESLRNPVELAERRSVYLTKMVVSFIVESSEPIIASAKESIAFAYAPLDFSISAVAALSRPVKNGTSVLALMNLAISTFNATSALRFRITDWKLKPFKSSRFVRAHASSVDMIERYEDVITSLGCDNEYGSVRCLRKNRL